MAKPRLLFNGRLDGTAKILNWAKIQKSLFFHEGGFDVTVLASNALVKAQFEARGLTVVNPRIASKWTDWNDFDVVVSPDLASPAGALWGGTLSAAQQQWLHNTLSFKGKLGVELDDPAYKLWHLGLTIKARYPKLSQKIEDLPSLEEIDGLIARSYDFVLSISQDFEGFNKSTSVAANQPWHLFAPFGMGFDLANPCLNRFKERDIRVLYFGVPKPERIARVKTLLSAEKSDFVYILSKDGFRDEPPFKYGPFQTTEELHALISTANASLIIGHPGHVGAQTPRLLESLQFGTIPLVQRAYDPDHIIVPSQKFFFDDTSQFDDIIADIGEQDVRDLAEHNLNHTRTNAKAVFEFITAL